MLAVKTFPQDYNLIYAFIYAIQINLSCFASERKCGNGVVEPEYKRINMLCLQGYIADTMVCIKLAVKTTYDMT